MSGLRLMGVAAIVILCLCAGKLVFPEGPVDAEGAAKVFVGLHKAKKWAEARTFLTETVTRDPKLAARMLAIALTDESLETRTHIISWVGENKFTDVVPVLVRLLKDPDSGVRHWAVSTLGGLNDPAARRHLQLALIKKRDELNASRVAISRLGVSYLKYFVDGLRDDDTERRERAINALSELGDPRTVPHLVKLLDSKETGEPWHAARALEKITGLATTVTIKVTRRPDGSVNTQGRRRPAQEVKKDCLVWVKAHAEDVNRPMPDSPEKWVYTPAPILYSEAVKRLRKGMSGVYARLILGEPSHTGEAGASWYYPKDRQGDSIFLIVTHEGVVRWDFRKATGPQK